MSNQNPEFQQGYLEAVAVFEAANHSGYCQNKEEVIRVARGMWKAELTGPQAKSQRSDFIASDRQKNKPAAIVKTQEQPIVMESISEIYARREREMSGTDHQPAQM